MLQPTKKKQSGRIVTVRAQLEGRVTTKIVTKKLKSGEIRRYRYYQLVLPKRKGKKVTSKYLRYLGKLPPPAGVAANREGEEPALDVAANRAEPDPNQLGLFDVAANQEVEDWYFRLNPEKRPTRARCARCGKEFTLIWFEREMGQKLCPRCRA